MNNELRILNARNLSNEGGNHLISRKGRLRISFIFGGQINAGL